MAQREPNRRPARRSRRWHPADESDELVYSVCRRFLSETPKTKKGNAQAIADWVREVFDQTDFTRERVYATLWEAVRRDMLFFRPPCELSLAEGIVSRFALAQDRPDKNVVRVVNVRGNEANTAVCEVGADTVLELIERLAASGKREVHIGFGAGASAMMVAKRLAKLIRSEVRCPNLVLHALATGGFSVDNPTRDAPITYFGLFDDALVDVQYVGLFCPTVVECSRYEELKNALGVRESFARRGEIDIVVTSFAAADDDHGLLRRFLESAGGQDSLRLLADEGWLGEIQFRPFSPRGPILTDRGVRAVTLFEIAELVALAQTPGKSIVLLSAPCIRCGRTRTSALRAILRTPELAAWTHLVTDARTARDLLAQP